MYTHTHMHTHVDVYAINLQAVHVHAGEHTCSSAAASERESGIVKQTDEVDPFLGQ